MSHSPEYMHKWYEARKSIYKQRHLEKTYGLTLADLYKMIEDQDHGCAICKEDLSQRNPKNVHIDHCHDTGVVRGVLCSNCNMALGLLKDNTEVLEAAIRYLKHHA